MKEGSALMHVYVLERIVSLYYRPALCMFTKLGRDEVLMVPYKCCYFQARSAKVRIKVGAKIFHGGPLMEETSSDRKASALNQMHSKDLDVRGIKCCCFWFHYEVKL